MKEKIYEYWAAQKVMRTMTLPIKVERKINKLAKEAGIKKYQVVSLAIDAYELEKETQT